MSTYMLINLFIIAGPVIMSFEKNVRFYRMLPAVLASIAVVSSAFIIWDSIAAMRGDWSFNSEHVHGARIFGLPIEEILFFVTVPYSTLFIYESLNFHFTERIIAVNYLYFIAFAVILTVTAVIFSNQYYTLTVLLSAALFIASAFLLERRILFSNIYWLFVLVCYLPFFIVNYILTSLPVVSYNPEAVWGIRLLTIPLEDLFYSFALVSFYLLFYLLFKRIWLQEKR